jgi:hypothetical protein
VRRQLLLITLICATNSVPAQEFEFEEPKETPVEGERKKSLLPKLPFRGKFSAEVGRQIDNRWVFLGPFLGLTLDQQSSWGQIYGEAAFRYNASYAIEKDSTYTREGYQFEAILAELYWKKSFDKVSISAGKILTVWGKADILPVSDVISARDATKAFFAQPQEARLGQNTIRVDWYLPKQEIQLIFIPYPVNSRYTDRDHPYSLIPGAEIEKAPVFGREVEGGAQYTAYVGGGAVSVFGGRFYNRDPLFKLNPTNFTFEARHSPYATTGISANFPLWGMLLKFDSAYQFKRLNQTATQLPNPQCPLTCSTITMPYDVKGVDTGGVTVGVDYNTTNYGSFIIEYSVTGPMKKDAELLRDDPLQSYALGYSKNFRRDTLSFNTFVFTFLKYSNILFRFNLTYKITDAISTYLQYTGIFIASGDPDLRIFDKYDRVDFQISYAFDLAK